MMPRPLPGLSCAFAALLLFAGCGPQDTAAGGSHAATTPSEASAPRLPGRIIHTDGRSDIVATSSGQAHCTGTTPSEAAAALASANAQRTARGLAPIATDSRLQRAAEAHACEMAQRGTMTHAGTGASGPRARAAQYGYHARLASENIAAGHFDLGRVLAEWSGSPKHAQNMLLPQLRQTGIGHATAADGRTRFWTVIYAAPR